MDDELLVAAKKIGEERERFVEDMAMGKAEEYAQYMHACGIIRGFDIVQGIIASLARKNMEDDDD